MEFEQVTQLPQLRHVTDQQSRAMPRVDQRTNNVPAQEAGATGQHHTHSAPPRTRQRDPPYSVNSRNNAPDSSCAPYLKLDTGPGPIAQVTTCAMFKPCRAGASTFIRLSGREK